MVKHTLWLKDRKTWNHFIEIDEKQTIKGRANSRCCDTSQNK